jgi:glycosyltransferase involved in cell wall biosynthesis
MKRRVAIITEIIAPYRVPVFNALARNSDIDPHVIFLSETDPSLREWRLYTDEIRFSYDVLQGWRRRVVGYNFLLNWGLHRKLDEISPEILICGGYSYLASWQAARWCNERRVPLVLWSESTGPDNRRGSAPVEFLKKQFLRKCEACVAAGRSAVEYLRSLQVPEHTIVTAPDAVDNDFFMQQSTAVRGQAAVHRRRHNLPERYFLYAGRLVSCKGVFDALAAYAALSPHLRSEVGLVFAGNGSARSELEQRSKAISPGRVQFAGFVQREDLPAFYALADMLIFPTHSDPWGLVVNEAMACGLPIITTSVAGCASDLVANGWNGLVVPRRSIPQLAAAMNLLACSAELRKQFAMRSAQKIKDNSPEACAQGLAEAAAMAASKALHG